MLSPANCHLYLLIQGNQQSDESSLSWSARRTHLFSRYVFNAEDQRNGRDKHTRR
jgi:hypothetical protein